MNKVEIENSVKLLKKFTSDICDRYNIKTDGNELEIRDYITETEHSNVFDESIFQENKGSILYLIEFLICGSIFPIITLDTNKNIIKFRLSYGSGEDSFHIDMIPNISFTENLKGVLPYFNELICKIIDYKLLLKSHKSDEFKQILLRDSTISQILD